MQLIIRLSLFLLLVLFNLKSFSQSNDYNPAHLYSVKELKEDFRFLRINLEKTHPNLYLYTPKAEFDLIFDSLYKSITNPLTDREFYGLVTLLNSKIRDGHTMFLPGQEARDYYNQRGKFFPFYIVISGNSLYVNMNCSANTAISEGAELRRINGIKVSDIIRQLTVRQIRDGNNKTYPAWILTNYFKEYFAYLFGYPDAFTIIYKKGNIQRQNFINALTKDSIKYYRQAKYLSRILPANDKQGIILNINKQAHLATLVIKSLDNELLKSVYHQDFDSTIKNIFVEIDSAKIRELILDLRNNQGGDFEPGKLLLSYLLRKPIKYLFASKEAKIISPQKNSFKGNLFVLINGGSFSSTAILCSYLELTKRAIFIGEETAGNKVIISGDPIEVTLPNTRILAEISTEKYLIRDGHNDGHGIVPASIEIPTVQDIISDKDPAMEFALRLIQMHE